MAALAAPGAMFPVSKDPSLATMRCTTASALFQTVAWFASAVTGLGLNDVLPRWPTMFTWPAGVGGGVGVGVGVGVGLGLEPPPPQPERSSVEAKSTHRW